MIHPQPGLTQLPETFLPLTPAVFHILVSLGEGERHGYAIMQEVAKRSGGAVRLGPGTLYGAISRLLKDGLIEEWLNLHKGTKRDIGFSSSPIVLRT